MPKLFNRAQMTITVGGAGTVTVGTAVAKYQDFAAAGVVDGDTIRCVFEDGNAWEISDCVYTATGTTLARTLVESSTGSLLNLTTDATVFITAIAEDIVQPEDIGTAAPLDVGTGANQVVQLDGSARLPALDGSQLTAINGQGYTVSLKSAAYTAVPNDYLLCDTSAGAFTITLPATPALGTTVIVLDIADTWDTNNLTVARNGQTIDGVAEDLVGNLEGVRVTLIFDGTTWRPYVDLHSNYLVNGSVALLDTAQTFTAAQGTTITALTDGASIATDAALSNAFEVTLAGNRALVNPTNLVAGKTYIWIVHQDATGNRTLSFGSYFKFPGGTAPTLSTAANATDAIIGMAISATEIIAVANLDYQ